MANYMQVVTTVDSEILRTASARHHWRAACCLRSDRRPIKSLQ